jgi:serine phosphatase RsbU (regulator of sigma subunit)
MNKFFLVIVSIFLAHFTWSQSADSLFEKLNELKNNEEKINFIYKKALKKKTSKETLNKLYHILDSFSVHLKNENERILAIQNRGFILGKKREFNDALLYLFKALKLAEKTSNKSVEAKIHMEIGNDFYELKNFSFAIKHLYSALLLNNEAKDNNMIAGIHCILGNIYKDEIKIDSALLHQKINLELNIALKDSGGIASAYNDIGLTYKRANNFNLALEYLVKALRMRESLKSNRGIAGANINIGNTLKSLKRYKEAMPYYDKGIELAKKSNNSDFYLNGIIGRAKNERLAGDYKQAVEDFYLYIDLKDSLYKQELSSQLAELEVSYQSVKKDGEILLQQEQLKLKSEQNSKQKILTMASIIALLLALVLVFFIYRSFRSNKKNALELATKNHLIEEKNKEITDSINYAKLIQQSLLASKEMLDRNLNNYFIFYKPKDIVSGDFYWAAESNNGFLMACVDCTGHGVPGAFMSLIGKENLDKAIVKTDSPKQLLHELNKGVKRSLNQSSSNSNHDGMDAAVIRIEKEVNGNSKIFYSGANRPIWIIKRTTGLLEEIKATKQAIGGFTKDDQEYAEHEFSLVKGDLIYIFTDGYADQFGSDKNKKMTTKRFKDLILSVRQLNPNDQKQSLENFFDDWKGNYEQLDDLLVIGILV